MLMDVLNLWIQIHFKTTMADADKMLYYTEQLFRYGFVLPKLFSYIGSPMELSFLWLGANRPYTSAVEFQDLTLQT